MKRSFVFLVLLAIACTSSYKPAIAPGPRGTIGGVIVDSSGAVLPGVTVTVTGANRVNVSAITDANGRFLIGGLTSGRYQVTTSLAGMGQRVQTVEITGTEGVMLTSHLQFASVSETITVTAEAPRAAPGTYVVNGVNEIPPVARSYHVVGTAPTVASVPEPVQVPQYGEIAEHDFVETKNERVTTFAIDVDRASYAIVRRFLNAGLKPPANAVRVEEMLNYFTYSYPQPRDTSTPFSVTSEVAGCPWNANNRLVRIGVQGANLEQWKMAPNNLVFLIDVSGSMGPANRLPLIQAALRVLVNQLRAEDRVSMVVYAGAAGLVLPSTSGADKRAILDAIDRLQSGGSTAGGAGIELAYKIATDHFIKGGNNRVILATDGDFNVGIVLMNELEKLIEEKRRTGVFLSAIGVGDDNYQDARMEMLADKGNGNYAYLDSLKEAEKVFKSELTGTLVAIAKDVKVQIDFDPVFVASYRQIGYENRALANKDFTDDTKDAGELGAGHSVTALYEIVPAGAVRGTIGTIKLRFKEPAGEVSREIATTIADEGKSAWDASPDMQFAVAIVEFAMLLRDSPHKGTANWDDVAHLARLAIGADLDGTREEFARLTDSGRAMMGERVAVKQ
jgi:Ca-activated chloride channel family protein